MNSKIYKIYYFRNMNKTSLKHWLSAARPRTLPASVVPVLIGCMLAYKSSSFKVIPALICFVFALMAQVVSNLFNDYLDFKKGSDRGDRLGPARAVAQGWIKPETMLRVSLVLIGIACLLGCILIYYAGWPLIGVGIAVALAAFAYSGGPYPLSYNGWGDFCVVIFYGVIPVGFTYYVQTLDWTVLTTLCGLSVGITSVNILVINNYRDRNEDKISGKRTTIVLFGEKFGRFFYLFNGIVAVLLCLCFMYWKMVPAALLPFLYLIPHFKSWKEMCRIKQGKELNKILGESARNVIIFGILLSLGLLLS